MARIIAVASGKGGVGKTTVVANLCAALARLGENVIAMDANLTTSNLGLHLGIPLYPVTLQDVINNRARVKDALYYHHAGFRILPADLSMTKILIPNSHQLIDVLYKLTDTDYVIIDCAAGLGREALAAVEAADELVTVATPDLPSMTDALKLGRLAEEFETVNLGVILNRARFDSYEISPNGVQDFLNLQVLRIIPEDKDVKKALAYKMPVINYNPKAKASREFFALAKLLTGKEIKNPGLFSRLFGFG